MVVDRYTKTQSHLANSRKHHTPASLAWATNALQLMARHNRHSFIAIYDGRPNEEAERLLFFKELGAFGETW